MTNLINSRWMIILTLGSLVSFIIVISHLFSANRPAPNEPPTNHHSSTPAANDVAPITSTPDTIPATAITPSVPPAQAITLDANSQQTDTQAQLSQLINQHTKQQAENTRLRDQAEKLEQEIQAKMQSLQQQNTDSPQ